MAPSVRSDGGVIGPVRLDSRGRQRRGRAGASSDLREDSDVAPDVVWVSNARLADGLDGSGHLRLAPQLVVGILSPGLQNERRDRETKLDLYARQGVLEYWGVDWSRRAVFVHRGEGGTRSLVATLAGEDRLMSPLLPDFALPVAELWATRAVSKGPQRQQ
ncbi:MAG: Uma2 family endonuclease [Chloroflexota bacterium]